MCKTARIEDRPVHMRFRSTVDDTFDLMRLKNRRDDLLIANITLDEGILWVPLNRRKIGQVTRVPQRIKIDDRVLRRCQEATDEMGSDEAGTTSYENAHGKSFGIEWSRDKGVDIPFILFAPVWLTSWLAKYSDSMVPASVHQPSRTSQVRLPALI